LESLVDFNIGFTITHFMVMDIGRAPDGRIRRIEAISARARFYLSGPVCGKLLENMF
jgi:hypothetical protein